MKHFLKEVSEDDYLFELNLCKIIDEKENKDIKDEYDKSCFYYYTKNE